MKFNCLLFASIATIYSFQASAADNGGFCRDSSNVVLADLAAKNLFTTAKASKDFMDPASGFAQVTMRGEADTSIPAYKATGAIDNQTQTTVYIYSRQLHYTAQFNDLGLGINTEIVFFFDDSCQVQAAENYTWDAQNLSNDIPDVVATKVTCTKGVDKSIIDPMNMGGRNEALRWLKSTCEKYFNVSPPGLEGLPKTGE